MFIKKMVCQFLYFSTMIRNRHQENKFKQTFLFPVYRHHQPSFLKSIACSCFPPDTYGISSMQNPKQVHLPRIPPQEASGKGAIFERTRSNFPKMTPLEKQNFVGVK